MSNKISLILSLVFVAMFFVLGGDIISLQYIYNDLDTKGVNISYLVSKSGRVDDEYKTSLEKRYDLTITFKTIETPKFGDVVDFTLTKKFKPLIMSSTVMTVNVSKSAIIGYFN